MKEINVASSVGNCIITSKAKVRSDNKIIMSLIASCKDMITFADMENSPMLNSSFNLDIGKGNSVSVVHSVKPEDIVEDCKYVIKDDNLNKEETLDLIDDNIDVFNAFIEALENFKKEVE